LAADLREAAKALSLNEIRYLVDTYYLMQDQRKRSSNQVRDLSKAGEPCQFIAWTVNQFHELEKTVAKVLDYWTRDSELGTWCRGIVGIGPVITAGLMSHISLSHWSCFHTKNNHAKKACTPETPCGPECVHVVVATAGHIWRYAGLDPTVEWRAKEKRPWNAALKTLCWKIGESFVKVSNHPESLYGRLYLERKAQETSRNDNLEYRDQAVEKLKKFNIGKNTDAYKYYSIGKLPPGHIHARAKRYAVKIFLSTTTRRLMNWSLGRNPRRLIRLRSWAMLIISLPRGRDVKRAFRSKCESEPSDQKVPLSRSEPYPLRFPINQSEPR